jgi:hypothetical protein
MGVFGARQGGAGKGRHGVAGQGRKSQVRSGKGMAWKGMAWQGGAGRGIRRDMAGHKEGRAGQDRARHKELGVCMVYLRSGRRKVGIK